MIEGVDLKDDLARFQVILKIPYPTLDEYTRRMMDLYPSYYENQVATAITQSYGRAVRSPEDEAKLYCLDGAFARLNGRKDLFTEYVLEAISLITTKDLAKKQK
jgi:Rad3-related DNA helicase